MDYMDSLLPANRYFKLKTKILLHFLFVGLFATILSYYFIWDYLKDEIKATYYDKLTTVKVIKKNQIEEYFNNIKTQLTLLSINPYVVTTAKKLLKNPKLSSEEENYFNNYISINNFQNLFLIDPNTQNILYSSIPNIKSSFEVFKSFSKNTQNKEDMQFIDFKTYQEFQNKPTSFVAKWIYDKEHLIAIAVIQLSIDKINTIMTANNRWQDYGYQKTGETYIIGQDCKMRNDSRFFIEDKTNYFNQVKKHGLNKDTIEKIKKYNTTILLQKSNDIICQKVHSGLSGTEIIIDYRGVEVLSSYTPLKINSLNWALLSEIDKEEALKTLSMLNIKIYIILLVLFVFIILVTVQFAHQITKQLEHLSQGFKSLSTGDFTTKVPIENRDEFGNLSKNFNNALDKLNELEHNAKYYTLLSNIDALTKLYNRRKLNEILIYEIAKYQRKPFELSLIMFDIDHFKYINDTYGHDIGDDVLKTLSNLITKSIRETDSLARWGGEEFIIVLVNNNLHGSIKFAKQLRQKIENFNFDTIETLRCSFGVTSFKSDDTQESFLKRVDDALFKAKAGGRNTVKSL